MLAVGADGGCLHIFLSSIISLLSPSLWKTVPYRLKYCPKGPKQSTKLTFRICIFCFSNAFLASSVPLPVLSVVWWPKKSPHTSSEQIIYLSDITNTPKANPPKVANLYGFYISVMYSLLPDKHPSEINYTQLTIISIMFHQGFDLLVVFGFNGSLRQYFIYIKPSTRQWEKEKRCNRREEKYPNNPHQHD